MAQFLAQFFRLNLISLKLNNSYKLNLYLILLLLICIISSILIRSNLITNDLVNLDNDLIILGLRTLFIFSIFYSIKLIFDNINRFLQSILIIPNFITWYKQDIKDIKSIISLYYLQNLFFILLSSFILYNIINKLSLFINYIDLFILITGILSSLIFFYNYPLKEFTLNTNIKTYPIWVYLLLIFFFIFYIFIFPLTIFKIVESDKFISIKNDFMNKCLENITNNMESELKVENNNTQNQNSINIPNRNRLEIIGNNSSNNNSLIVRDNRNSLTLDQVNLFNDYENDEDQEDLLWLNNNENKLSNNSQEDLLLLNNNENKLLLNKSQEDLLNNNENELSNNSQENLLNNKIIKKGSSSSSKLNFKDKINKLIYKSKSDTNLRIIKYNNLSRNLNFKFINKDFALQKENVLRILTKDLIRLSDYISIINNYFTKLPVNETKLEVMSIYNDLYNNIEDFKNIQKCLLNIKDLNKIEELLDQNKIGYLTGNKITANSEFIKGLHRMLINDRLLFVYDLFVFKEYYVLNDLDYLNYKNKNQIIDLRIYNKLNKSLELNKILIETLNLDLKVKNLLTNYNSKVLDFYNHFDKFTLDDYNRKYKQKLPKFNINQIKNSREIEFFEIWFKK